MHDRAPAQQKEFARSDNTRVLASEYGAREFPVKLFDISSARGALDTFFPLRLFDQHDQVRNLG
jgi:hypothetical protein